jgi:hypothetical protein
VSLTRNVREQMRWGTNHEVVDGRREVGGSNDGDRDVDTGADDGPDNPGDPSDPLADDRNRKSERVDVNDVVGDDTENEPEEEESSSTVTVNRLKNGAEKTSELSLLESSHPGAGRVRDGTAHDGSSEPLDQDEGEDETGIGPGKGVPGRCVGRSVDVIVRRERDLYTSMKVGSAGRALRRRGEANTHPTSSESEAGGNKREAPRGGSGTDSHRGIGEALGGASKEDLRGKRMMVRSENTLTQRTSEELTMKVMAVGIQLYFSYMWTHL